MAATSRGWKALPPPISTDITAVKRRPRYCFHHPDGFGGESGIGQTFLADKGRAHVGHDRDEGVIIEVAGVHQVDARAVGVKLAHVEVGQVGRSAASGAEDPRARGQGLQFVPLD